MSEQLAWIAGFFDGEGCILLRSKALDPTLVVVQRSQVPLLVIQARLGGALYAQGDNAWQLIWRGKSDVGYVLELLLPYFVVKKLQAELMLDFVKIKVGTGRRYTAEAKEKRLRINTTLKTLKHTA
jgi:hypothetical protein